VIIDENFEGFPEVGGSADQRSYENWTLAGAYYHNQKYLKIEKYKNPSVNGDLDGFALTPSFNYSGNALFSFNYLNPNGSGSPILTVSIENGGYFDSDNDNNEYKSFNINITTGQGVYNSKAIKLHNTTGATILRFKINNKTPLAIDNVKVIKLGEITLNESYDPAEAIEANTAEAGTINIQTRRMLRAGIWNTLCLPFDVTLTTLESAIGTGRGIELRTYSGYDAGTKTMNFATPAGNAVSAGTPFLIKFSGEDVVNPTFSSVTLSNESAKTIESNGVSFVGTYKPVDLTTDGTSLFITTANKLAKPKSTGNRISGLRAFITVPSNFAASQARLAVSGGETTAIDGITADSGNNQSADGKQAAVYTLHGQLVKTAAKGLYIVNGKLIAEPKTCLWQTKKNL